MPKKLCPICEEGHLTEHSEMNELFCGIESEMCYSTCDFCGSDQANADQIRKNAATARAAYKEAYNQLALVQPMPDNALAGFFNAKDNSNVN